MNRLRMAAVLAGAFLASAVSGCSQPEDKDGVVTATVQYGITYTGGAANYDDERAKADLDRCLALPGASSAGQDDSLPPAPSVRFKGSLEDQDALERCLTQLPGAVVSEPRTVPSGF